MVPRSDLGSNHALLWMGSIEVGKVVVLDMEPGDVLVFKTDHAWTSAEVNEWVPAVKELLGVDVLVIDPEVELTRFSAKRIRAIRRMFADARFREGMNQLGRALRPLSMLPDGPTGPTCGIATHNDGNGVTVCGKRLDPVNHHCPDHGGAWERAKERGASS
jgi:hypothetical protein